MKRNNRKCPVCRVGLVIRADVRTCSDQCAKQWRSFSWDEKQSRLGESYDEQVLTSTQVEDWARQAKAAEEEKEAINNILKAKKEE